MLDPHAPISARDAGPVPDSSAASSRRAPGRHRATARPNTDSRGPDRRQVLKFGSLAVVAAAAGTKMTLGSATPAAAAPGSKWQGHQPGKIYLGASTGGSLAETLNRVGAPLGLQRTYYRWSDGSRETRNISQDHAANRLPWVSYKPPSSAPGGWAAIARGTYDSQIRERARRYAGYRGPVVVTFNHEPHNDSTGSPADFARAWTHIHDVMNRETGLQNVVDVPIIGDWTFNPVNRNGHPEGFLTQEVLNRCAFVGVDLYQNQSGDGYDERLGRVLSWLNARGHSDKMVGVGETGCTEDYRNTSAAQWWNESWSWSVRNANRVAAISYFNSQHNNNSGNTWLLWESTAKLNAFRASVKSSAAARL